MKNLYLLQTLLVVLFSSVITSWTFGQLAEPVQVHVRNTETFSDQFPASTTYTYGVIEGVNPQLGLADIGLGSSQNTLKVMFTPLAGVTGQTDLVVTYYTLNAPVHPVTKRYRFYIADELVLISNDKFVVDAGGTNIVLDVLANDSVTNGELFLKTVSVSNAGQAIVNASQDAILFSPAADFLGDTWIQYITCDSSGNCGQGTAHVLVRDPAVLDHLIYEKSILNTESYDVLTPFEDFDVDIAPAHGTLTSSGASGWTYTPEPGFIGKDTFRLTLLNQVSRKYHINVYQKNINVHARNDKFYVRPGLTVNFNVLNNDLLDYEVSQHTNPSRGILTPTGNGSYTYTPVVGFKGVDKFTYTTCFQDTVYCETATVLLHVTDLEPDNQFSYELQTSKNNPLIFDYPIDYTDFSYIISEQPANGTLTFYAGLQQINLPCDTIDRYNMIVYEPATGYTGTDHFEYYYCIQPSNLCYLVKVDMNVVNHPEAENCPCTVGCVWPGDTDRDGRVDMSDLLTLANRLGDAGPTRDYTEPALWFGQHHEPWLVSNLNEDANIPFADADGDGTVTADDVDLIDAYYYQTHDVVVKDVQQKLPYQFTLVPVQYSLDSGDVVILDVVLGNASNPVIDLKGAKFSVNLPPFMVDSSSVEVIFHQDSWLAQGAPFISLGKVPWDGRIDAGIARAKGKGGTGTGVIATIVFIIEDDIEGFKTNNGIIDIPVTLLGGTGMDNEGTKYDIDGDEIILQYDLSQHQSNPYKLVAYPNPATDLMEVHVNGKTEIESIQIVDPQGRKIEEVTQINSKHHELNLSSYPAGIYYMQVNHTHGVMTQVISVIR